MGTNYYLMTKSKELVSQYFDGEYEIVDSPYMGYRIHLNKCSMGWKTAFQSHRMAYTSVKELRQFLFSHKNETEIYDEYDEKFSVDQYDREVLHRDENTTYRVALKWGQDKFFGGYTTVEAINTKIKMLKNYQIKVHSLNRIMQVLRSGGHTCVNKTKYTSQLICG